MLKWLKYYREKLGLSMNKLAERLGIQLNTVWRWENGRASPSVEMVQNLAQILGISESKLLNGPNMQNWKLKLIVAKTGSEGKGGIINMAGSESTATLSIGDTAMAITLSAEYALWEDDAKFEELIEQLRRKRAAGLKTRKENW